MFDEFFEGESVVVLAHELCCRQQVFDLVVVHAVDRKLFPDELFDDDRNWLGGENGTDENDSASRACHLDSRLGAWIGS